MSEPLILVIGGADTGRAPMTAALLRRLLTRRGLPWAVTSAGVLGHDDAPAEPEARSALLSLGLDLSEHRARSLNDELVAPATLLLAVDRGVARVLRARYPEVAIATLSDLAGSRRDIPDPFRMQVGAWLLYAAEIETMLHTGLPRLMTLIVPPAPPPGTQGLSDHERERPGDQATGSEGAGATGSRGDQATGSEGARESEAQRLVTGECAAAVERAERVLALLGELPGVVDWAGARRQITADLAIVEQPLNPGDLARPYIALVRALLALTPNPPTPAQAATMSAAIARLRRPITPADLDALSAELNP